MPGARGARRQTLDARAGLPRPPRRRPLRTSRSSRRTSPRARGPWRRTRRGRATSSAGSSSDESTPGTVDRDPEREDVVGAVLGVVELARERRVEEAARRLDRHPVPLAVRPARPARVDEPDGRAVPVELLAEHPRVHGRGLRQEGRAEARRERRLRLLHADLGAGELRGESGEEVVERLVAREPRDRRQDPEGVGGQHDDRARMPGHLRPQRVRDPLQLVGGARVLGLRVVVEVDHAAVVDGDVLEHGAEGLRRLEDLGLGLGGEPDHLRVAPALDVEDAVARPSRARRRRSASAPGRPRASSCPYRRGRRRSRPSRPRRRSPSSASGGRPRAAAGRS